MTVRSLPMRSLATCEGEREEGEEEGEEMEEEERRISAMKTA